MQLSIVYYEHYEPSFGVHLKVVCMIGLDMVETKMNVHHMNVLQFFEVIDP